MANPCNTQYTGKKLFLLKCVPAKELCTDKESPGKLRKIALLLLLSEKKKNRVYVQENSQEVPTANKVQNSEEFNIQIVFIINLCQSSHLDKCSHTKLP